MRSLFSPETAYFSNNIDTVKSDLIKNKLGLYNRRATHYISDVYTSLTEV